MSGRIGAVSIRFVHRGLATYTKLCMMDNSCHFHSRVALLDSVQHAMTDCWRDHDSIASIMIRDIRDA